MNHVMHKCILANSKLLYVLVSGKVISRELLTTAKWYSLLSARHQLSW